MKGSGFYDKYSLRCMFLGHGLVIEFWAKVNLSAWASYMRCRAMWHRCKGMGHRHRQERRGRGCGRGHWIGGNKPLHLCLEWGRAWLWGHEKKNPSCSRLAGTINCFTLAKQCTCTWLSRDYVWLSLQSLWPSTWVLIKPHCWAETSQWHVTCGYSLDTDRLQVEILMPGGIQFQGYEDHERCTADMRSTGEIPELGDFHQYKLLPSDTYSPRSILSH